MDPSSLQNSSIKVRDLSADNKINIIIGVLTIIIGVLSAILAWATWRLTGDRVRRMTHEINPRHRQQNVEEIPEHVPPQTIHAARIGYELAMRVGRDFRNS